MDSKEFAPAYPSPSTTSMKALHVQSDSDWSTASDFSSTHSSPVLPSTHSQYSYNYPPMPLLSDNTSATDPIQSFDDHAYFDLSTLTAPSSAFHPQHGPAPYPPGMRPGLFRSVTDTPKRARIPRPPNAFMIFRSDFLKKKVIPSHVEKRQQNLSRIAGEVWNLMEPGLKRVYQDKAAAALLAHQTKYPTYKFSPAPRSGSKAKTKASGIAREEDHKIRNRALREAFVDFAKGPAVAPQRKRRAAKSKDEQSSDMVLDFSRPSSAAPSTAYYGPSSPFMSVLDNASCPPSRPASATSLSLGGPVEQPLSLESYSNSASPDEATRTHALPDFDATPTAANFRNIPTMPPRPEPQHWSFDNMHAHVLPQSSFEESALGLGELKLPPDMLDMTSASASARPPLSKAWMMGPTTFVAPQPQDNQIGSWRSVEEWWGNLMPAESVDSLVLPGNGAASSEPVMGSLQEAVAAESRADSPRSIV
ncbi:hypothetical protein FA95DRAFT_1603693 [Auriscalpium vulgare]|uniref:Uncharacterized protein n=1 Tax=Auriscalpium vulgare TaxID=40419 RepID=A0ACB8S2W8_9AGAM|nr:hypothetical protein FA95DRAFT_1603693 [Auriscalpium vulgare]